MSIRRYTAGVTSMRQPPSTTFAIARVLAPLLCVVALLLVALAATTTPGPAVERVAALEAPQDWELDPQGELEEEDDDDDDFVSTVGVAHVRATTVVELRSVSTVDRRLPSGSTGLGRGPPRSHR